MLPSRGPIQVTLEDTGSRAQACNPPTQVKILRRPKPVAGQANNLESINSATTTTKNNPTVVANDDENNFDQLNKIDPKNTVNILEKDRLLTGTVDKLISPIPYRVIANLGTTCGSGQAAKISGHTTQQTQNCHHHHQQKQTKHTSPSSQYHQQTALSNNGTNSNNNNIKSNKKLMKTYQERADEYAKARLRILGSAFPENDDSLTNNDDVNRILNLDFTVPTCSSSSYSNGGPTTDQS